MVCSKCGRCCSVLFFTFNDLYLSEDDKRYYEAHNIKVKRIKRNSYRLEIPQRCKYLTEDNLCSIFEDRPRLCKEISGKNTKVVRIPGCTED